MKREYYINKIKKSGLKIGFIAEKLNVHRSTLSRFLNDAKSTHLNTETVHDLDNLLSKYS